MSQKRTLAEAAAAPPSPPRPEPPKEPKAVGSWKAVGVSASSSGECPVCDAMLADESVERRSTPSKRLSTLFRLMHASSGLRGLKLIAEETNRELMEERDEADNRKKMQDSMKDNWKHLPDTLRYQRTLGFCDF